MKGQRGLDGDAVVVVQGVHGPGAQQIVQFVSGQVTPRATSHVRAAPPMGPSVVLSLANANRKRDFAVPSGMPSWQATSR